MSFLDKFKTKGRDTGKREDRDDDLGSMFDEVVPVHPQDLVLAGAGGAGGAIALDQNAITTLTPPPTQGQHDSSMMSEALASEVGGDYGEAPAGAAMAAGSGLPLIGHLPLANQQRSLFYVGALGFLVIALGVWLAISSAGRSAAQVGATGQALMQSQRLAKSVSQALLGSASAFGEVREASEVLARNVRALKDGGETIPQAPFAAQGAIEPLMPLVDRAEKSAAHVLARQPARPDSRSVTGPQKS